MEEHLERKLMRMFDFHKFEKNNKLNSFIDDVEKRYGISEENSLDDDELLNIYAAGTPNHFRKDKKQNE